MVIIIHVGMYIYYLVSVKEKRLEQLNWSLGFTARLVPEARSPSGDGRRLR
jgi:hypothetical protein